MRRAEELDYQPIILKEVCVVCGISQAEIARSVKEQVDRNISRPTMSLCLNKGYVPTTIEKFKPAVENFLSKNTKVMRWMLQNGISMQDIWKPLENDPRKAQPSDHSRRTAKGMEQKKQLNTEKHDVVSVDWEVEAMHPEAMKKFNLFRNPFVNDVNNDRDIFLSDEHRYIEMAMMDAAMHCGFIAVIGEVGSGKSTIRKKVIENLKKRGDVAIIYPRNHKINMDGKTQSRINAVSLCDAIIMDISDEKPKLRTEHKVRQLESLLIARVNQGFKHVIVIEEAHNLTKTALKYLKQFHELEDGFKKLTGIIIIGQSELKDYLDERRHPDLREVIRRIQIAEISGLNGSLRDYLQFKFNRVGAKLETIFEEDFFEAITKRLTFEDSRNRKISHAYPNLVQSCVVRAINLAWEMGYQKVNAEIVEAI